VAAYRADIEIGVRGQRELERLRSAITQTSEAAESLNRIRVNGGRLAQSLENYNTQLERARRNLEAVATASLAENKAITEYVTALGSANAARARQNDLIEDEIRLQQTAARVARLAAAGIRETSGTTQLGPGPASPIGSLVGQKSPVAEKINQTLQARQDEVQLQAALLRLEEKSAAVLNEKLELQQRLNRAALAQGKTDVETVSAQQTQRQQFLAGTSGTALQGPLAGPGAMGFPVALSLSKVEQEALQTAAKKQEILQRMVATKQALVGLASNLQQIERSAANTAAANAVQDKIAIADANRLNAAKLEELEITQRIRATEAAASNAARQRLAQEAARRNRMQNAGFGMQGPAAPPSFLQQISNPSSRLGSAVIGGGFPALMGGGPGTIAGGALGGILGGFAGSIGGSAIGQFLDTAIQKVQELGNAINTLNFDKVTESGIRLTGELRTQLDLLLKVGQAQQAQELVSQEVAFATGTPKGTTEDIGNAVNLLNVAFNSLVSTASTLLGIIGAPFVAALAAVLQVVNLIVKGFNVALGFIGSLIKDAGEWLVNLIGGENAVANIERGLAGVNGQFDEAISKANQLRVELNQAVVTASQNLGFERRMTPGSTAGEKLTNNDVELEKKLAGLTTDRLNANIKIREENAQAELAVPGTIAGLVQQNNLAFDLLEKTEKLVAARKAESIQIQENTRLAREAARAAEEAARALEQRAAAILKLNKEYYADKLKVLDLDVQQVAVNQGNEAALTRQLEKLNESAGLRVKILTTEYNIALAEATKLGTVNKTTAVYAQKFKLLQAELNIEQKVTEQKRAQIQLDKQLRIDALQRDKEQTVRGIQVQQNNVGLDIAAFTTDPKLIEKARLELDQLNRAYEKEFAVQMEIDKLNKEMASGAFTEGQLTDKQRELDIQQSKLSSLREELTLLDSLEQRQLRLQQFYATYGQLIQSVSGEIANAVTFGVAEMVKGTKTAKEVFADFLNAIGAALISAAQQMIATYIAIGIAKIFAGMNGGGGLGSSEANVAAYAPLAKGGTFGNGVAEFANGGAFTNSIVSSPTMFKFADGGAMRTGLMGEAGPEAIMPLKRGADGSLGVQANGLREAMNQDRTGGSGSPVLNMSFQSTSINGVEYVSRDQLEQAMAQTRRDASRDGAKRGMTMTLDKLQQSPSTRSRVGMR
jgi:lambda family phage tail tape measure protein